MKKSEYERQIADLRGRLEATRVVLRSTREQMSKALAQAQQDAEHYQQSCRSLQWALTVAVDALRKAQTESLQQYAEQVNANHGSDVLSLAE
jgi:chromosome segregation ATPase